MNHAAIADTPAQPVRELTRRAIVAAFVMVLAAALAWFLTPTHRLAEENPVQLESMIPPAFGDWTVDRNAHGGVVNPQQTDLINRLYSQTLSRTYINSKTGARVMLSVAYGEDQRDGMQLHYPEVCYPAQGFQIKTNQTAVLVTQQGSIPTRRLESNLGSQRMEPITYWTVIGDHTTLGGLDKKLVEMRYGLNGVIPDGLLFRVSSIERDSPRAFGVHDDFVRQLIAEVPSKYIGRLTGLGAMTGSAGPE
ncbi:MAG: EpsI family protein [Proteobacteria bacterium]|nr:MAG: EpsI family protein [Pseudomonadota bacterium]